MKRRSNTTGVFGNDSAQNKWKAAVAAPKNEASEKSTRSSAPSARVESSADYGAESNSGSECGSGAGITSDHNWEASVEAQRSQTCLQVRSAGRKRQRGDRDRALRGNAVLSKDMIPGATQ